MLVLAYMLRGDCIMKFCKTLLYHLNFSHAHIATPTDPYNEMHLQPEPLFHLPSDNVAMLAITGTSLGRIFLAGKDGCLYEVAYQVCTCV